jgi:hypothetical protein
MAIREKGTHCGRRGSNKTRRKLFTKRRQVFGHVDMAGVVKPKESGKLANKLLTFAINGLSHSYCIIVGYFPVANLTAEELKTLSLHVIKEVESIGYSVEGMVADNASINTKMIKLLNPKGKLNHEITHPNDPERKFFISFDSSHII